MHNFYYSTKGYFKSSKQVPIKLFKLANVSAEEAINWLDKQPIHQIYNPPPKYMPRLIL